MPANHKRIDRRHFLAMAGTGVAGLMAQRLHAAERKPNIVVIIVDDMGYSDIGVHGCRDIPTPNIDSIAGSGVRFSNGYVSCPVCSPTRAGLMTGRYQQRFGHEFNTGPPPQGLEAHVGLPLTEVTVADLLRGAGYVTGAVGKWHQGIYQHFHPSKRGFDEFFGFLHGGHSYIDPGVGTWNPILRGEEQVDEKEYLTDAFSREAVAFIDRHREQPFYLYLSYNAVHTPMQAPDKYLARFPNIEDKKRRTYAAMLSAMDDGVGAVLGKLREHGLEENTLLFFIDDNGGPENANGSINDPLRAGKGSMYEGGTRVPFMVKWPGRIPAGEVYDNPVIALDILPTAVAAADGNLPGDRVIDGVDLLPHVTGKKRGQPHGTLFWRAGTNYAMRGRDWKLVRLGDRPAELYDLAADISEANDLAQAKPEVLKRLTRALADWESELVEPVWTRAQRQRQQRTNTQQRNTR